MERVKKGERYWYVCFDEDGGISVSMSFDDYTDLHDVRNRIGNYFHTKEEAEVMAERIRKVLKGAWVLTPPEGEILSRKVEAILNGADVIEMPSEKEIEDAMKTSVTESIMSISPYGEFTQRATDLLECAWLKGEEWLKSKIVK